jgi:hypothetical protein
VTRHESRESGRQHGLLRRSMGVGVLSYTHIPPPPHTHTHTWLKCCLPSSHLHVTAGYDRGVQGDWGGAIEKNEPLLILRQQGIRLISLAHRLPPLVLHSLGPFPRKFAFIVRAHQLRRPAPTTTVCTTRFEADFITGGLRAMSKAHSFWRSI